MAVGHSAVLDKLRDRPRPIRLRPGAKREGRSLWFFLLLPHTYVGIVVGAWVLLQLYVAFAAPVVDGRVTNRRVIPGAKSTRYELTYTYPSAGQRRFAHESVGQQLYDTRPPGTAVKVRAFFLGRFGGEHLVGHAAPFPWLFLFFWVSFWNVAMATMFYTQYILPRRRRWLIENGEVATGVIITVTKPEASKNRRGQVKYQYALSDGQSLQGSAYLANQATPPDEFLTQGRPLTVFYSPDKPRRNVALELSPYEIPGAEALTTFTPASQPAPLASAVVPTAQPTGPPRKAVSLPRPPRQIRRLQGRSAMGWVFRVILIVFLLIGYNLGRSVLEDLAMATLGRDASATVVRSEVSTTPNRSKRVRTIYAYQQAGNRYEDDTVSDGPTTMPVGATLPIKAVHLGRIGWSVPASRAAHGSSLCCLLPFALVWNAVVLLVAYAVIVGGWRTRQLLKNGESAEGVVTAIRPSERNPEIWQVVYEFTTSWGERCTKEFSEAANRRGEWQLGHRVPVLYWPGKPSRAMIYQGGGLAILDDRGNPIGGQA